jgi:hypothetical protein
MRMPISKEQFVAGFKKSMNYAIIIGGLAIGFQIGRYVEKNQKSVKEETNPYSKAFSPEEISIAVNEGNELILIERKTGKYIVYSDQIGMTIFKMYTNRIYQDAKGNE